MDADDHAGPYDWAGTFVHLDDDGTATPLGVTESFWPDLISGQLGEPGQLERGRLITLSEFDADWPMWERHPAGDELVYLLEGAVDIVLERRDGEETVRLDRQGAFVLVPRGVWHTARTTVATKMLFITPGAGTGHRPVKS